MFSSIQSFVASRRIAAREVRRKQTRRSRALLGCALPSVQSLERREMLSGIPAVHHPAVHEVQLHTGPAPSHASLPATPAHHVHGPQAVLPVHLQPQVVHGAAKPTGIHANAVATQVVTVRDLYGRPLAGASVSVATAGMCYAPFTTNSQGQVSIATSLAITTILVTKTGYVPSMSSSATGVNLSPTLLTVPQSIVVNNPKLIVKEFLGLVAYNAVYVGRMPLSTYLTTTSLFVGGVTTSCVVASGAGVTGPVTVPCAILTGSTFTVATFFGGVYSTALSLGLAKDRMVDVYVSPTRGTHFIVPSW